jgi:nucleoside 2-deoxyribosyltransferase
MLKAYLAGPEVFLPEAIEVGLRKKRLCNKYGFIVYSLNAQGKVRVRE